MKTFDPEQCLWRWWNSDEPETGLLGFHTKADRDAFSAGKPGPYRRRVADDGRTISQHETWDDRVQRLCDAAGVHRPNKRKMQ